MKPVVGILALQGDYHKHGERLAQLGVEFRQIRMPAELKRCTHLIIPGGESTTLSKLMDSSGLRKTISGFGEVKPIWGTCAGMILLGVETGDPRVAPLGLIDVDIDRNAYGRQIESFSVPLELTFSRNGYPFHAVFIRAPKLRRYGKSVTPLAKLGKDVVIARNENILISSFHPELTNDSRIHEYFVNAMGARV